MSSLDSHATRHRLRCEEQEAHAAEVIRAELHHGDVITSDVARLIAATVHAGPGTALERFAASGAIDAESAIAEIDRCLLNRQRANWVIALWDYIERLPSRAPAAALAGEVA
jgi:hypothetical protein